MRKHGFLSILDAAYDFRASSFLFTYLFLFCSSLRWKLSSCVMAKFNKCLILMRWNMCFFLLIRMATSSLCVRCVIHSLFWLSTHDSAVCMWALSMHTCADVHVCMCLGSSLFLHTQIYSLVIFNTAFRLQLMGQFKFGVLIKSISFNLIHSICIIQTNYLLLCCERSALMTCIHPFIPSCRHAVILSKGIVNTSPLHGMLIQ